MLAEALKIMLFEDRQRDMQKAAAFVKRLATFSLSFGSGESLAGTTHTNCRSPFFFFFELGK